MYKTLLNDKNEISDYSIKILEECKKKGAKIILNTFLSYKDVLKFIEKLNPNYISCFGGNYVFDSKFVYRNNYINSEAYNEFIKYAKDNSKNIIVQLLDRTYRNRKEKYNFVETIFSNVYQFSEVYCYEIMIERSKENEWINDIVNKYKLLLEYDSEHEIYIIKPNGTNKVNALKAINSSNKLKIISFGDDISDYETLEYSDIPVRMINSSQLCNFDFWTLSNNDDGVARFLSNFYNLDVKVNYDEVKILDCTLRDGGHLNKCSFGYKNICKIINNLINANTDIIEIGFLEDCNYDKNFTKFDNVEQAEKLIKNIDIKNSKISLLAQVDKYDIRKLKKCSGKIDIIRLSFHKELLDDAMEYCRIIKEKGYICSLNPINFSGYDNYEIIKLISKVNKLNIDYFSIVDTFGILLNNDFENKLNLINNLLKKEINVGLHLHDNLSSAFSTAQILIQKNTRFGQVIIDSSLLGMGRDPGNLKTELIMYYLNKYNKEKYDLKYIYSLLENEIKNFKKIYKWEHDFSYSISAFEKTHRSYAEFLKNKDAELQKIEKIIKRIPYENRIRYNENIIKKLFDDWGS